MDFASVTTSGVLVLDRTGAVFSLLRSLNLGVPLWRITTAAEIEHADISLTVVAAYDETDWPLIGELAGFRSVRAAGQRYRIVYRVERRETTVLIVAVGRRRSGDKGDIYELARKLLRQGLLRR